jgi:hypothetical protein
MYACEKGRERQGERCDIEQADYNLTACPLEQK